MNETERLRLALKYKYKYKYKYEVKKSQDRSTPLLGDSWDLDPALRALKMSEFQGVGTIQEEAPQEEPEEQSPVPQSFEFRVSGDEFTLERAEDLFKGCKRELDIIWRHMVTPPAQAASLSKRDLREMMREQRQALLPQEKSAKKMCDHLKGLIRVFQDAQKADLSGSHGDNVQTLQGNETSEEKVHRGNERVQTALKDLNVHMISHQSLLNESGENASLVKQLRHELGMGSVQDSEPSSPEAEKQGWNKSVFADKKGKHAASSTSSKRCGFREYKADPWARSMKRYG